MASGASSSSPIQLSNRSPRIYSASAARASFARKCTNSSVIRGRASSRCRSEMKRVGIGNPPPASAGGGAQLLEQGDFFDDYRRLRHITLERSLCAGFDRLDLVDGIHAVDYFAEHAIT